MSISTCGLKRSARFTLDTTSCIGFRQVRHILHVSTIGGIKSNTSLGDPACWRSLVICSDVACHHRKCSLRSSRRRTASSAVRRAFDVRCMANLDQSVGASPVAASSKVLRWCWLWWLWIGIGCCHWICEDVVCYCLWYGCCCWWIPCSICIDSWLCSIEVVYYPIWAC